MSRLKFIFFSALFSLRMVAQVSAPDLRCLEVINAAGDVKLSWIPPADPSNVFYGYAIYVTPTAGGTFTLASAAAGPVSQNSFIHSPTSATVQSVYYYVCSLYGPGGTFTSSPSDTLHTIFLNILPGEANKLQFNDIHEPRLSSSVSTFTISREYPVATWTPISILSNYNYNDTLSICNSAQLQINYQVKLFDNSGCFSASNLQGGEYHDRHDPYMLFVDSISVLPDGRTILSWLPAVDKDVVKYEIQKDINGKNTAIDQVSGYSSTSYILSGASAMDGTVGIYVKGIDSCANGGVVDYAPSTMHLKVQYDYCRFTANLSWTPYKWASRNGVPIDEVREYRVYLSEDSGVTFKSVGTTTTTAFTHTGVIPGNNICYYVRMFSSKRKITSSTNRRFFYSVQVNTPDFVYIRSASVVKRNTIDVSILVDDKHPFKQINLMRAEPGKEFTLVGEIPYSAAANYTFTDEKVSTDHIRYSYLPRIIDSCGNTRLTGDTARTILLRVTAEEEDVFTRSLSWTPYEGFDAGVGKYEILRMVRDAGIIEQVAVTDSLHFIDQLEFAAPYGAKIEYQVTAVEGPGNHYGIFDLSRSNVSEAYMEGRLFVPNAFAPNGINKTWKPITHFVQRTEYNVSVYNRWGQLVFETGSPATAWDGANCAADIYAYIISYRNSRGEYEQVAGYVTLIR